jgi:hypothetical protein
MGGSCCDLCIFGWNTLMGHLMQGKNEEPILGQKGLFYFFKQKKELKISSKLLILLW